LSSLSRPNEPVLCQVVESTQGTVITDFSPRPDSQPVTFDSALADA
jgi:hypothetical protein